jgi:hypothetical protein
MEQTVKDPLPLQEDLAPDPDPTAETHPPLHPSSSPSSSKSPNLRPSDPSQNNNLQTRPPTPNWPGLTRQPWMGFTPIPDFQHRRENEHPQYEEEETDIPNHHADYWRLPGRPREAAMEPMSIRSDFYLDYRDPQNIKFFNKGSAKLPGDPFGGKNLFSWLRKFNIRATEFQWNSTLTIQGKILTSHFAEITHTPHVMDKFILKAPQYTLQIRGKQIQDGVLLLKVLIDSYYASTRTTAINLSSPIYPTT